MRSLVVAIALTACGVGPTPLYGSIACENMQCGGGQVCRASKALPDDGGIPAVCVSVPETCTIFDCQDNACSTCIQDLCDSCRGRDTCFVTLRGRSLRC